MSLRRGRGQHLPNRAPTVHYSNGSDPTEAAATAASADIAIVVVGSTSSEGSDRRSTSLPHRQLAALAAVAAAQPRTVVLLMAPGAVAVGEWIASAPAVVCYFLPGQACGEGS